MPIPDIETQHRHMDRINDAFFKERGFPLSSNLLVMNYIGSMSHNTYVPSTDPDSIDDVDFMGVIVPPMVYTLGITPFKPWRYQQDEYDVVIYSMRHFSEMMTKANPNMLCMLWQNPEYSLFRNQLWDIVCEMRMVCVSQLTYDSFGSYARGQMVKMDGHGAYEGYMGEKRKQLVNKFGYDPKMASHTIRLLRMGLELLLHQRLTVYRTDDAEELKSIKRGEWSFDDVKDLAKTLLDRYDAAIQSAEVQALPERPNARAISTLCAIIHQQFYKRLNDGLPAVGGGFNQGYV